MSLNRPIWKLRDWIDINKIEWDALSENENAIELLKENKEKINWAYLSNNKNAIELIEENLDKINWNLLSLNETTIKFLKKIQKRLIGIYYHKIRML
jgi:hypothetical protein